jgi:tetratricopeptide (TPR) repeat protein
MTAPFTRPRRFCVAAAAVALAGWLFAPQIADGLVVRGDDFMYRNASADAMNRYERALTIDPRNAAATDRIVFTGMELRTAQSLRRAVDVATAYLDRRPHDTVILADRALCYLIQRRYALARSDFERAATLARDPRYFVFAGWAAQHAHDRRHARDLWTRALAIDPHYRPALSALERSH